MSKLCLIVHLICTISLMCNAARTCSQHILDKSSRSFIKREYGSAARNALQLTEIDSHSIDLFSNCLSHVVVSGTEGLYTVNLAVISFNIPADYLDNSGDSGYTGRFNVRCKNGNWLFDREDVTPRLRDPAGVCASCNTQLEDPCQPCLLRCAADETAAPDCSNCERDKPVTSIVTLSAPPWVTEPQEQERSTVVHTTRWIGTTVLVNTHKTTHDSNTKVVTSPSATAGPIKTFAVSTGGSIYTTQEMLTHPDTDITTTANQITTKILNSTSHHTTPTNRTKPATTLAEKTAGATANFTGGATANFTNFSTANFTYFSSSNYVTVPSLPTNATTEDVPFTTNNFTTAQAVTLTPNTTTEGATVITTLNSTALPTTVAPVRLVSTKQLTEAVVQPDIGDSSSGDGDTGDGDTGDGGDTHVVVIDDKDSNNSDDDEDEEDTIGPTSSTCIEENCSNGGEGICKNGVFQYCVCPLDYSGTYCDIISSIAKVDDRRTSQDFWDWKLSKYIIGGLGIFLLIGILMSICMVARCVRGSKKDRHHHQDSYYDVGLETFLPSAPVVVPPNQHESYRGSSDVLDESRSDEEFHLHDSDNEIDIHSMATSSDIQVHRPRYHDPEDDGLLHPAPSHRVQVSPEHYKVPTTKNREYMNMNGNSNTYSHKIKAAQPDAYAHLNRSYSRNASHNYLNIP